MFPGPGARIYRNEAGEPLGWDYPSDDPTDYYDSEAAAEADAAFEEACEIAEDEQYQAWLESDDYDGEAEFEADDDRVVRRAREILAEWRQR